MRETAVVAGMRRQARQRVAQLGGRLDGLHVIVQRVHDHFPGRGTRAVPSQLFELQALPVFAAHVHQQAVVRDTEYPAGLRRGHFLVPDVLQRLGELGVRPRPRRATPGRAVLTLRPTDGQTSISVVPPSSGRVPVAPVFLRLLDRMMGTQACRAEQPVKRLRLEAVVQIRQKGTSVEGARVREEAAAQRSDAVQGKHARRHRAPPRCQRRFLLVVLLLMLLLLLVRMRPVRTVGTPVPRVMSLGRR